MAQPTNQQFTIVVDQICFSWFILPDLKLCELWWTRPKYDLILPWPTPAAFAKTFQHADIQQQKLPASSIWSRFCCGKTCCTEVDPAAGQLLEMRRFEVWLNCIADSPSLHYSTLVKFKSSPQFSSKTWIGEQPWPGWEPWTVLKYLVKCCLLTSWSWQSKSSECSFTAYVKLCKIIQSTLSSILQDL